MEREDTSCSWCLLGWRLEAAVSGCRGCWREEIQMEMKKFKGASVERVCVNEEIDMFQWVKRIKKYFFFIINAIVIVQSADIHAQATTESLPCPTVGHELFFLFTLSSFHQFGRDWFLFQQSVDSTVFLLYVAVWSMPCSFVFRLYSSLGLILIHHFIEIVYCWNTKPEDLNVRLIFVYLLNQHGCGLHHG